MKRRLLVSLVLARMLGATVAGSASATPSGYVNGNHYGEYSHNNNGKHIGAGVGAGRVDNNRRGLR